MFAPAVSLVVVIVGGVLEPKPPHGGPGGRFEEASMAVDLLDQAGETQQKEEPPGAEHEYRVIIGIIIFNIKIIGISIIDYQDH